MNKKDKLITEKVYSPINDKIVVKNNISKSPIWKNCYKENELIDVLDKHQSMYCYTVKFDGTTPIQLVKFERVK